MKKFDFANQFTLEPAQTLEFTKQSTLEVHTIQGKLTKQRQKEVEKEERIIQGKNYMKA